MNCQKIQELILTDYIDARLGDEQKSFIDKHLDQCHSCERFLANTRSLMAPLKEAPQLTVDPLLWSRIKQGIEEEQQQKLQTALKPGFWESFRLGLYIPQPVYVLGTLCLLFLMVGLPNQLSVYTPQAMNINGPDQVQYLSSLMNEPAETATGNGNGLGTPLETYFL
jgi:predicted anti-sigma-YlaC factor YlaD